MTTPTNPEQRSYFDALVTVPRRESELPVTSADRRFVEARPHALYDRLTISPGQIAPMEMFFFTEPLGRYQPGTLNARTYEDTNMLMGGYLPAPRQLFIERIMFLVDPASDHREAAIFAETHYVEFVVGEEVCFEAPLITAVWCGSLFQLFDRECPYHQDPQQPHKWPETWPGRRLPDVRPLNLCRESNLLLMSMMHFRMNLRGECPFRNADRAIQITALLDGVGVFSVQ